MMRRDWWSDEFEVPIDREDYLWGRAADILLGGLLAMLIMGLFYIVARFIYG